MLLSTQNHLLLDVYGFEESLRILKSAGYDAYDMSLFKMFEEDYELNAADYHQRAQEMRTMADAAGLVCNQAHAPYGSSTGDPQEDKKRFEAIVRSMEIAAILGARIIVVHPKTHLSYITEKKTLWDMNLEFYRALAPYAKQFGIKIALENMWQFSDDKKRIVHCVCARPEEFKAYLDELDDECFCACLDIGHAALVDEDIPTCIRVLGQKYLQALHVHDVDYQRDLHTMPYTQRINWEEVTAALAEINYQGDLTFEADNFLCGFPKPLWEDATNLVVKVGRHLISEIEIKGRVEMRYEYNYI